MSLKKSLRILLILFSTIPALLIGILIYAYLGDTLISHRTETLTYLAKANSEQIQSVFQSLSNELETQSKSPVYSICLQNLQKANTENNHHSAINEKNIRETLFDLANHNSISARFTLYDTDLCIISSCDSQHVGNSNDIRSDLLILSGEQKSCVMDTVFEDGAYSIDFAVPVYDSLEDQLLGYLGCTINAPYLQGLMETSYAGESGDTILLDSHHRIIYSKKPELIGTSFDSKLLDSLLSATDSKSSKIKSQLKMINGKEQLFVLSSFSRGEWHIIISQDVSEITASSNLIMGTILLSLLAILGIVYFAAGKIAYYYTNPIYELRNTMKKVSNGDFNVSCQVDDQNEIGDLARNFNKMIKIIQSSYDDLAAMHEQLLDNEEEIRANYNHIEYLAYHDLLTNLPNKLYFLEQVDLLFSLPENKDLSHGIYFLDMDNFKTINDTLGHDLGDEILTASGKKLSTLLSSKDILARVGGDEFLLFKYDIGSEEKALHFSSQILSAFAKPFIIRKETVYVGLSIGIALYPQHGNAHKALVKNADIAMYKSKELGRNRASVFDKFMENELNRNIEILDILRTAVENHEVYLMYQPQIDSNTHEIIGFEALMRINSQKLGPLAPKEFIPIAEESGLIVDLGLWALREACRFNKQLIDMGHDPRAVSVNISSIQLNQDNFIQTVKEVLEETELPPQYLELEITESTLISSLIDSAQLLQDFQSLGVRISLDDFGTGYSSLKYLTSLPINTLKIDKSFVDNICSNSKDNYIARSIIKLAHQLNIKVIAEGVEDEQQFNLLKEGDCDIIQGYLFSRPLLPDILIELLATSVSTK